MSARHTQLIEVGISLLFYCSFLPRLPRAGPVRPGLAPSEFEQHNSLI